MLFHFPTVVPEVASIPEKWTMRLVHSKGIRLSYSVQVLFSAIDLLLILFAFSYYVLKFNVCVIHMNILKLYPHCFHASKVLSKSKK